MTNIEIIFTSNGQEPISWDVYPNDLDVERTLQYLISRYPQYSWDSRYTSATPTVTYRGAYFKRSSREPSAAHDLSAEQSAPILTAQEQAYLGELAAQIVSTLGPRAMEALQVDPLGVLTAAHERRQEFAQEMIERRTDRAKIARNALTAEVYHSAKCT
jgi:hypothetical protein